MNIYDLPIQKESIIYFFLPWSEFILKKILTFLGLKVPFFFKIANKKSFRILSLVCLEMNLSLPLINNAE